MQVWPVMTTLPHVILPRHVPVSLAQSVGPVQVPQMVLVGVQPLQGNVSEGVLLLHSVVLHVAAWQTTAVQVGGWVQPVHGTKVTHAFPWPSSHCLLYTSDAADD